MTQKTKYITTAIDYVNNLPHLGTAYEKIGADVLARYYRLMGYKVMLQMGNDEHSANVQKAAQEKGMDPKQYCDDMRPKFEEAWQHMHVKYDQFVQTTEPRHHAAVQKLFQKIHDSGDIYLKNYEGWYCESCEAFYTEKDLVNGHCPNHKAKPKWLEEQNYFFKLSKYSDFLLNHIEKNPNFILPAKRRNEIVQFIKHGLADVSISRSSFDWGIPLPIKKEHVIYVWFDALINYISGIGYAEDEEAFFQKWNNVLHIIGKDITRFHCIIWPSMLQSAGLPLPESILGHGFISLKGEKMSKSLGNVVRPLDVIETYPDFGADAVRYYLMRGSSFGDDGDFTWESFIERYNADLANGFGNLVSRTMGMVWRYQKGVLKPLPKDATEEIALLQEAQTIFEKASQLVQPDISGDALFHSALEQTWAYITKIDQYIDKQAPWTLAKEGKTKELSRVLTTVVEAIRLISFMASPIIPKATKTVWEGLGFQATEDFAALTTEALNTVPFIKQEHTLTLEKLTLFPRIDTKKKEAPKAAPTKTSKSKNVNVIDITDFAKVELKVAQVLTAEKVDGADKLLKLQIEI
ncbi:methionine--tRNA ligase, partial [bacterium]|nr:methionine--tRNA ligase [bacterium]